MNDLHPPILDAMRCATPQTPASRDTILDTLRKTHAALTEHGLDAALEQLLQAREINTATITRRGDTQHVYWPTGMKALAGNFNNRRVQTVAPAPKPKEEPPMRATKTARLIMAIEKSGPISRNALAMQSKIQAGHIEAHLKPAIGAGTIVARQMYSTEHGKDLPHYMTRAQADAMVVERDTAAPAAKESLTAADIELKEIEAAPGLAAAFDNVHHDRATLLNLIGADSVEQAAEILTKAKQTEHTLRNDAAAYKMLLDNVCRCWPRPFTPTPETVLDAVRATIADSDNKGSLLYEIAGLLGIEVFKDIPDKLREILRAEPVNTTATAPHPEHAAPSAALVLITANGLASLDDLKDITDPSARAVQAVEDGEACRAILVHIVGEARRTVEWRTAA